MAGVRPIRIGRYVLHGELAAGGMASVHFGRLLGTGGFAKTVAIKRLHRTLARDPKFRESILEEGRLAARIRHPNVVSPLDVLSEASELLLVMEYVHGESLSKLLKVAWAKDEVIPVAVGAAIMANTLHGLHAAHEAKDEQGRPLDIVHRDVSPQNVLVGVDGVTRVIDFGIAKAVTTQLESTSTGVIKGKVPYLAPEQLEGEPATRRTDVYAASVVLWEVLAGHRLFEGEDDSEILRKILGMPVGPPSAYNPSVPRALDDIVLKGLARKPEQRFATAREMALAIEELVHPATSSVVGAWTERLAVSALAKRAAQLAQVEATDRIAESPAPSAFEDANASMSFSSRTVAAPAAELARMPESLRGPAATPAPLPAPKPSVPPPIEPVIEEPPPTHRRTPRLPPAGALRKPALEIPNVEWLPQQAPPKPSALRRVGAYVLALLLLALLVVLACLPMIVRSMILSGAASRGIALDLGRVEVSRRAIKLVDVRVRTNDLPGMVLQATTIDVALVRFSPSRLELADVQIELDGTLTEVNGRVDRFRASREAIVLDWAADLQGITITSGRVEWKNALGSGTHVRLENITMDSDRVKGRALGEDHHFTAPLLTIRSGDSTLGPWYLDSQRGPNEATTTLKLDPSGTYPATVTWKTTDLDSVTVTFAIPRVSLANVHLPPNFFGPRTTPAAKIEVRGEITLAPRTAPGRPIAGRLSGSATGLDVFPPAPAVDLTVDLPVAGDGTKPVVLDRGTAALSVTESRVQLAAVKLFGSLDVTASRLALDLVGRSTSLACSGKGETKVEVRTTLAADKMEGARFAIDAVPACIPKVIVAK